MKPNRIWAPVVTMMLVSMVASNAVAKVPAAEADKLGKELTCSGAEAAGNKEGTIPPFSGKWLGVPPGIKWTPHVGQHPVDVYPNDKPLYTITAGNMAQYADHLSDGQKAMFKRYPQTFRIPVYPGRRDFRFPDKVCEVFKKNALEAALVGDGPGYTGYKGTSPFPIPKNAMEVLVNLTLPFRAYNDESLRDNASVGPNGKDIEWGRLIIKSMNVITSPEQMGKPVDDGLSSRTLIFTLLPERQKGRITSVTDPVNYATSTRMGWSYDPGTRRVRQLPEFGYDEPIEGTSGKLTVDQDRLMNGPPDRYNWKLLGKREMYIPANSYRIHANTVKYADLLKPGHANPDYLRFELRRVWVLEGSLKPGYRHIYAKRVLYIDEDHWMAPMADYYDGRGQLWQYAFINYYYDFDITSWHAGTSFYHDLNSGGYVAYNLFQELKLGQVLNKGDMKAEMFTPAALRSAGN